MIDQGEFEERAAVLEYDQGMTRFAAETEAARRMGCSRWEAIGHVANRVVEQARHQRAAMERAAGPDHVPGVQPPQAQENRPMPERHGN